MRALLFFENPWCLFTLLLIIALLLIAAALVSLSRRTEVQPPPRRAPAPQPRSVAQHHQVIATAPYEALLALRDRLHEFQRHMPPNSDDARWLQGFLNDLRNVIDDVYWELGAAQESQRVVLLERLADQVAQFDQAVTARLVARPAAPDVRVALEEQLEQVRRSISSDEHT